MFYKLSIAQKILYLSLLGLIILMVIFSFGVREYLGKAGYEKCIEEKCGINEQFCKKSREIINCCNGAGGQPASSGSELTCVFN